MCPLVCKRQNILFKLLSNYIFGLEITLREECGIVDKQVCRALVTFVESIVTRSVTVECSFCPILSAAIHANSLAIRHSQLL